MGTVYIEVTANSGESLAATVERMADGYFREDDAETFGTGLAFSDKDITLTEGSAPNLGSYSASLTATTWDDGIYKLRIHDKNDQNGVIGSSTFGVVDGNEVSVEGVQAKYHIDIQYINHAAVSTDEYRAVFFKNASRMLSGISNAAISVIKYNNTRLIDSQPMTAVDDGSFRYITSNAAELQTAGDINNVVVSGSLSDSSYITYSWILGRDSSS